MKITVLPEVEKYLECLKKILFENEYFGFEQTAQKYVDDLFLDIKTNLSVYPKKIAPKYFERYGKDMYYVKFKKNNNTQWYVFFNMYMEMGEIVYVIRYIANNHLIAQYL